MRSDTLREENFYAVDGEDGALFSVLMDSDAVDKRYKAKLMPRVLEYYVIHDMEEELERYLKKTDVSWLDKNALEICLLPADGTQAL